MENDSNEHFVYILRCADKTLYTGYARDLKKRLSEHNGKSVIAGAKYTHSRRPVKLLYSETYTSRSAALQREYAIKQLSRPQKLALITAAKKLKRNTS
jgi:putative endonuclease